MQAILSANIQGLCPSRGKHKLAIIKEMAAEEGIAIIALTESHLNSEYHEGEIAIPEFSHYRADRCEGTRKGGVIVYVNKSISPGAKLELAGSFGNVEYAVLSIPLANMTVICVYRPPTTESISFTNVLSKINDTLLRNTIPLYFAGT